MPKNNEQKNFYVELLEKIETLKKEKKYQEALSLIEEELEMPYIPLDIESKLKAYFIYFTKKELLYGDSETKYKFLAGSLYENKIKDFEKFLIIDILSSKYRNICDSMNDFSKTLMTTTSIMVKYKIINLIKKFGCETHLVYLNKNGEQVKLSLNEISNLEDDKKFANQSALLDNNKFNDEVIDTIAFIILENYFIANFPNYNLSNDKDIGIGCLFYSLNLHKENQKMVDFAKKLNWKTSYVNKIITIIDKQISKHIKYN